MWRSDERNPGSPHRVEEEQKVAAPSLMEIVVKSRGVLSQHGSNKDLRRNKNDLLRLPSAQEEEKKDFNYPSSISSDEEILDKQYMRSQ